MRVLQAYRVVNYLSLDVVAGAVCSSLFFRKLLDAQTTTNGMVVLALSVWIIYTLDHIIDAIRLDKRGSTGRHRFHQRFRTLIIVALVLGAAINVVLITMLETDVLVKGCIAGIFTVAYLVLHKAFYFVKELVAAILYCIGITIPLVFSEVPDVTAVLFQFFTVVLMNLILFSCFDYEKDIRQNTKSMVTFIGLNAARYLVIVLFVVNGFLFFIAGTSLPAMIVLIMGLVHLVVLIMYPRFQNRERYRIIGDACFLLPAIVLL